MIIGLLLIVIYFCALAYAMVGDDFPWLIGMVIAYVTGIAIFGGQAVGAFAIAVALTIAITGWARNLVRWLQQRRAKAGALS